MTAVAVFGYLLDILISARRNGNFGICRYGVGYERGILTGVKKAELQVAGHIFNDRGDFFDARIYSVYRVE